MLIEFKKKVCIMKFMKLQKKWMKKSFYHKKLLSNRLQSMKDIKKSCGKGTGGLGFSIIDKSLKREVSTLEMVLRITFAQI